METTCTDGRKQPIHVSRIDDQPFATILMKAWDASRLVNGIRNDFPELLVPL
jgi:hypothetical protein